MMGLTRNEFLTLDALRRMPGEAQRSIADKAGISVGSVNASVKSLQQAGLIEDGSITDAGMQALAPYKVDNAIIMAAGLSTRFAPVSYERPKGVLKVRGEVLIERQIEQLHEAGIRDVIVVVGYKKEQFFYLEDRYGVTIVVNPDYAARNNHSSLYVAREQLGNSYICSSDNYFTHNPFSEYEYGAYYSAQYCEGPTDEFCMVTGTRDRIMSVCVGGADSWYMTGHAYFDGDFSRAFTRVLEEDYDKPLTSDKLWEELYIDHLPELDMEMRKYPAGTIFEFDTLDDLRAFDPFFLENIDSEAFDNIVSVLGCEKTDIHDVYPLKEGLTNLSCHIATSDGEYVYRHPGIGTEQLIDRGAEVKAQQIAKQLGIDDTFIFEDPAEGWKLSRFLPDCTNLDVHEDAQLAEAMRIARTLHEQDVTLDRSFDFYEESKKYERILLEKGPIDLPGYAEQSQMIDRIVAYVRADGAPICLTHNDFFDLNLLRDTEGKVYLIDWEYAGMADYASDYGTFVVTAKLSDEEALRALEHYFERTPTPEELRHNLAYVALAGWCWYLWALVKEAEGDYVGEWLYIYYEYAKRYMRRALELYEGGRDGMDENA